MDPTERIWLERGLRDAVVAGDDAAWRELHDRHFRSLYAYVYFRAGRRADWTEDVVQECWMTAVRRIEAFDPSRGAFEGWLRGIADNVLRNLARRSRAPADVDRANSPLRRGADAFAGRFDLAEQIALTLSGLPIAYQEVLRAKYERELPVAEIAASTGKTAKTIESLLSRARAAFREAFARLEKGN
jgi:RNA polymerase sigma-70 factor (ECF subfamily)